VSDAIFIVGYYRSGTSALSGALHRLGVPFHNDAEPNEHNPLGFYEIPELIEFDVELFDKLGVDWHDLRSLPEGWSTRADMAVVQAKLEEILRRRFGAEAVWGLKHPHMCRLLPMYETAARRAGNTVHAIHICRDPWSVAASQAHKNKFSRAHAVLLWVGYLIDAERQARHLSRAWTTYDRLLADPDATLRQIGRDLNLGFQDAEAAVMKDAKSFLTGELKRSKPVPKDDLSRPVRELVEDVWAAVQDADTRLSVWDDFQARYADFVGLISEISNSAAAAVPGIAKVAAQRGGQAAKISLRPPEREDEGAKRRLLARRDAAGALPSVAVILAAPPNRAHALGETLESLNAQWLAPDAVEILSVDPADISGRSVTRVPAEAGALTRALCRRLNELAETFDYVAILNAGDTVAVDACIRFALQARTGQPDLIYCDEIVPADTGPWARHKPVWDVTRLRQSAYLGDWVWYRGKTVRDIGGFDENFAGVEEYELQLRLAERQADVVRLPETLFTRAKLSRRDNIPATEFGPLALQSVALHLNRAGLQAEVFAGAYLGLFGHKRVTADPGTAILLICDHVDLAGLDRWMKTLLGGQELTGPVILTGATLSPQVQSYLTQVAAAEALRGKIFALPPGPDTRPDEALRRAVALADTEHLAIIEASAMPVPGTDTDPHIMLAGLRERLADPAVGIAAARTLIALAADANRFTVQGPIIRGADTRLGAGHFADDPGPGGWLAVDQEADAVAPGMLLLRRAPLAACRFEKLKGDALWIDLCAQIKAGGQKIVWTPAISCVTQPQSIKPDYQCAFRDGSPASRALPMADGHHHPALSLHGDLLLAEGRLGLVGGAPADPADLLLSGNPQEGMAVVNAVRALRMAGRVEAGWAPDSLMAAEIGRRAPAAWVRINPGMPGPTHAGPYTAVFTKLPNIGDASGITAAHRLYATSPAIVAGVRKYAPGRPVTLWRPALSPSVWRDFTRAAGLNTKPRILWIDENIAPPWMPELINSTTDIAAWIVVERAGSAYAGDVARLTAPEEEQGFASNLAALAPHILVRPAGAQAAADHYAALLGAAAGCHLLVDDRLDMPASLGAKTLPDTLSAWQDAVRQAVTAFSATQAAGQAARAACLALPGVEAAPPGWAPLEKVAAIRSAAE
jgi:hypothetical protein